MGGQGRFWQGDHPTTHSRTFIFYAWHEQKSTRQSEHHKYSFKYLNLSNVDEPEHLLKMYIFSHIHVHVYMQKSEEETPVLLLYLEVVALRVTGAVDKHKVFCHCDQP